jgi:dihydrofolate synthase/folylpolyglutamate synthase
VRGLAATYDDLYLPLYGAHQGHNAALAIAAVESLIGAGDSRSRPMSHRRTRTGDLARPSPADRCRAHRARRQRAQPARRTRPRAALGDSFDFDEWGIVLGAFADKDIAGIVATSRRRRPRCS